MKITIAGLVSLYNVFGKMNKPVLKSLNDLLSYDAVRYCETFFQYCRHIQLYFEEKLTDSELKEVRELLNLISVFLHEYVSYPSPYKEFYSRYQRMFNHYKSLETW